jgi:hypothetical protein
VHLKVTKALQTIAKQIKL